MIPLRRSVAAVGPGAFLGCLVTLVLGFAGAVALAIARGSTSVSELAFIYVPVMLVPFAFAALAVLLPVTAAVRAWDGGARWWVVSVAGAASAPLQASLLLIAGHFLFEQARPTDFAAALHWSADTGILLAAFAVGGVVPGLWSRNARR